MGFGYMFNRFMSGITSMSFLSMSDAMTAGGCFFMFGSIAFFSFFFFLIFVPETKGIPLEEIIPTLFLKKGEKMDESGNGSIN
mmetsp:Transcript_74978/g.113012  ORF Transcript_74978/g.113012 Transcript_74978/m.113012 type:complete len:83 (-) Transcript_74978:18-266(-)